MRHTIITLVGFGLLIALPAAAQQRGQQLFENWDLDQDGKVTVEEAAERRSDVFASFDADESGALEAEEMDLLDEARADHHEMMAEDRAERRAERQANGGGMGQGMGQGRGQGMGRGMGMGRGAGGGGMAEEFMERDKLDLDGDGKVSRDEFVGAAPKWIAVLDKDGDGVVTPADFGR